MLTSSLHMNYDAVLFDAAETLFTTRGSVGELYAEAARDFGSTAAAAEIQSAFARQFRHAGPTSAAGEKAWWRDVVRRVFAEVGMVDDFDGLFERLYGMFRGSGSWMLYPETLETLESLKARGLKLGIVSNFDSRIYGVLDGLAIRRFFDAVTISSEVGTAKPDPEIFHAAVRAIGVPDRRILFTGDNLASDVEGGARAGLFAVLVDRHDRHPGAGFPRVRDLRGILGMLG
jgi:putative hydrolase of the HAD superfamily